MNLVAKLKLVKLIMALAMFWLFIGDLIILHQSRIFGHDYFGQHHQPLNKPGKSDDGKTFQKYHKAGDKGDDGQVTAITSGFSVDGLIPVEGAFLVFRTTNEYASTRHFMHGAGLRAPPVLG